MQFPVPQFIDVEDKIIGPLTLKQLGLLFGGGILIAFLFKLLYLTFFFFILALPLIIATTAVTFGSFNGKKIYDQLPMLFNYLTAPKVMVFNREVQNVSEITAMKREEVKPVAAPLDDEVPSKLKKLSMVLEQKNME